MSDEDYSSWRHLGDPVTGSFGLYEVSANLYENLKREIGWKVVVLRRDEIHGVSEYWVQNEKFYAITESPTGRHGEAGIVMSDHVESVDPEERGAVLAAIAEWERRSGG